MILSDGTLHRMLDQFIKEPDHSLVNPASIDIRIGSKGMFDEDLGALVPDEIPTEQDPYKRWLYSKQFALVETYEHIMCPNGYTIELRLKSSIARMGFNHSMAFWVDPGWNGVLTMEIYNLRSIHLRLYRGMRFAQLIVNRLDTDAVEPYNGRYQGATQVEAHKP